jgi:predicted RND superfamily exporter protein
MDANKSVKDVGIFLLMGLITILIMSLVSFPVDYILTYERAVDYNKSFNSFKDYFTFYLLTRLIFLYPIFWIFVETFKSKYKRRIELKLFFIIIASLLVALISQSDMSVSVQTEFKRFFTYPISGLLAYYVYAKCFYRKSKAQLE